MDILVRVGDFGNIFSNHIIDSHHILSLGCSVEERGREGGRGRRREEGRVGEIVCPKNGIFIFR